MITSDCEYFVGDPGTYEYDGKCSHPNALSPTHSWCIGKHECYDYKQKRPVQKPDKPSLSQAFQSNNPALGV